MARPAADVMTESQAVAEDEDRGRKSGTGSLIRDKGLAQTVTKRSEAPIAFMYSSKAARNKDDETDAGNLGAADRAEEFEEVKA